MKRRLALTLVAGLAIPALATGGTSERAIVIIDPTNAESLYVGNYYKFVRQIPDDRVIYMTPCPGTFNEFLAQQRPGLLGTLAHRGLESNTDFVVVTPGGSFFMTVPSSLVADGCSPVRRFSVTGAYSNIFIAPEIAAGGWTSQATNGFYRDTAQARSFDGATLWFNGRPDTALGDRSFIGCMLGYTGERGNTLEEILDNIDRSVLADGTFPGGTFYFMQTNDQARSGPRHGSYPAAVSEIIARGGQAEHRTGMGALPNGEHDCLGIMTGLASPGIAGANFTILPGAYCDHLTSWAATFDQAAQEKISAWIKRGASGSWGQVEEPCNYAGKFPVARIHVNYFQGITLGEACFRSIGFVPFQGLMYGDPLTRPWAYIPDVSVSGMPSGPTDEDFIVLTATATTDRPGATIGAIDTYVDGALVSSGLPGFPIVLDTRDLADGWHDVRIVARDSTLMANGGTFASTLLLARTGHSASIEPEGVLGDLSTTFTFDLDTFGDGVIETRLVQNGRVVAAVAGCEGSVAVRGQVLGAGPGRVFAEALLHDGSRVRSAPLDLGISFASSAPSGQPPQAFSYTKILDSLDPMLVELPFNTDRDLSQVTFTILSNPTKGTLAGAGGWRVYTPNSGASGKDSFTFRVDTPDGSSQGTVTILFGGYDLDRDNDGHVDVDDMYFILQHPADLNLDGLVNMADRAFLESVVRCGEQEDMRGGRR